MYRTLYSPQGGRIILDGREVINMASNNYLGLANHPAVVAAAKEALEKYGVATTASRNICGNYPVHDELEEKLAKFKGVEATLVFNCGVTANSGLIPQLVGKGDFIYSDELNHGSIIDGCRLSGAKIKVFRHMDMAHLEELLQEPVEGKRLIITDGVFSMDGDLAPLPKMADLADQYNALLVVDDAHGDGVMGPAGRGTVDHFGLRDRIIIETGSLSKAFGSAGGFVAGPKEFIEALRPKARSFIFTASPMAPCLTAAAAKAVDLVMENTALVDKLWENRNYFADRLSKLGLNIGTSVTPVIPIIVGDAEKETEKELLDYYKNSNLTADVLKVGHHGSETSSTKEFLAKIQPKYAVISCGEKNKFRHPRQITLDNLTDPTLSYEPATVYLTDLHGNVVITVSKPDEIGGKGKMTIKADNEKVPYADVLVGADVKESSSAA